MKYAMFVTFIFDSGSFVNIMEPLSAHYARQVQWYGIKLNFSGLGNTHTHTLYLFIYFTCSIPTEVLSSVFKSIVAL